MRLTKTASGKTTLSITRTEWERIGASRGWMGKSANRLPAEELAATWEDDRDGEYVQIDDDGDAVYVAHGKAMEHIPKASGDTFADIRAWMDKKRFWPNIWSVNDHGNVTLHGPDGQDLGGLV